MGVGNIINVFPKVIEAGFSACDIYFYLIDKTKQKKDINNHIAAVANTIFILAQGLAIFYRQKDPSTQGVVGFFSLLAKGFEMLADDKRKNADWIELLTRGLFRVVDWHSVRLVNEKIPMPEIFYFNLISLCVIAASKLFKNIQVEQETGIEKKIEEKFQAEVDKGRFKNMIELEVQGQLNKVRVANIIEPQKS
jgi:hypothetical protein